MDLVLNKNFYNYVGTVLFGGVYQTTTAAQIGTGYAFGKGYYDSYAVTLPCNLTDTSEVVRPGMYFTSTNSNMIPWNHTFFNFNQTNQTINVKFVAGSGSTAATINDNALTTPNTNISAAIETGKRDTTSSILYTVTFSTTSGTQILREIGLQRNIYTSDNTNQPFLFGRAVFDEDIELSENNPSVTLQIRLALPIPA